MSSRNCLAYFVCIPAAILLFTVLITIINNIFLSSHNSNALMYNVTNQASFDKHMPFKHQFIQSIYADSNIRKTAYDTSSNQNGADAPAIKQPIPWITILSFIISIAIVSGIFIFVAYSLKGVDMKFGDIIRDGSGFP